jgi:serine/threonine protein kinase
LSNTAENILISTKATKQIKLIDFGSVVKVDAFEADTYRVGTRNNMSPQIALGNAFSLEKQKVWTLGTLL